MKRNSRLITEPGEEVAVRDLYLGDTYLPCGPSPNDRPDAPTFEIDIHTYRIGSLETIPVVKGEGGQEEAFEVMFHLQSLLRAIADYEDEGLSVDVEVSAVELRDRVLDPVVGDPLDPWRERIESMIAVQRD